MKVLLLLRGHKQEAWIRYSYVWFTRAPWVEYNLFFFKKSLFEIHQVWCESYKTCTSGVAKCNALCNRGQGSTL